MIWLEIWLNSKLFYTVFSTKVRQRTNLSFTNIHLIKLKTKNLASKQISKQTTNKKQKKQTNKKSDYLSLHKNRPA